MNLLAIDYGLKKVGLAWAQDGWVQPLSVWPNDQRLFRRLVELIGQLAIKKIVVGLPEGSLVTSVEQFVNLLQAQTDIKVVTYDETLTSREALVKMNQARKKTMVKRQQEDAFAAAILLENYLTAN